MVLEVETTEILDIQVEVVPKDRKIGAFLDKDFEHTEEDTVRPVFKCKLSDIHKNNLGGLDYVWVDASCLAGDSGNVINAMKFATSRKCELTIAEADELEKLLLAIVSVSGSNDKAGVEAADEEENDQQQTGKPEDKKEESKNPTTAVGTTGAGTSILQTPMK